MIFRIWHAYATPANADTYQEMIATEVLPGYHRFSGYRGTHILRREENGEVEFVIITTWESWKAVEEFAGPGHKKAVIWPKAAALLTRYDAVVMPLAPRFLEECHLREKPYLEP